MKTIKNVTLFLVDDNLLFLKSLEFYMLHNLNYTFKIKAFTTGEEALQNLHLNPDIIILDYILNSKYSFAKTGIQVLQTIKKSNPEIEVIMMSVIESVEMGVETIKHGGYDYIIKNEALYPKLQTVLRNVINSIAIKHKLKSYKILVRLISILLIVSLLIIFRHLHS